MDFYLNKLKKISLLKPSLPQTEELLPWLKQIDNNRWYTNFGPLHSMFCEQLESFFPNASITITSSGTSALELTLASLDLPKGSKILLPALTFPATIIAILKLGLVPVLADVDNNSWQLTPEIFIQASEKTAFSAVIPVATFGIPVSPTRWEEIKQHYNCAIIIDAAGAFGNQILSNDFPAIFSLHATKTFSTAEGGLIVSHDRKQTQLIKQLTNFGFDKGKITSSILGNNAKMSEYHAAIGLASFERWPNQLKQRKRLLNDYLKYLSPLIEDGKIILQDGITTCCLSIICIRIAANINLSSLMLELDKRGIETRRWYYPLLHEHMVFSSVEKADPLDNSQQLTSSLLGLPFHTDLSDDDIHYICEQLDNII